MEDRLDLVCMKYETTEVEASWNQILQGLDRETEDTRDHDYEDQSQWHN